MNSRSARGQGLAEFALILPVLLLLIFGVIEFGRLFAIYSMVSSGARNATRYGAAVGNNSSGTPYYLDCAGIRSAAKRTIAALLNLPDSAITIQYDDGQTVFTTCDASPAASTIDSGDRLKVTVSATYTPLLPIVKVPPLPFTFISTRTIIKEISGPTECNDSLDNDSDTHTDYGNDPDCQSLGDNTEGAAPTPSTDCNNGIDDDFDGFDDFPADLGCSSASDTDETTIIVTFVSGYPMHKSTGSPKPIYVKAQVVDEWGNAVTDATVQVTAPITATLGHNGSGVYGNGSGSCYSGGNVTPAPALVTVTATKGANTSTLSVAPTSYTGSCT